MAEYGLLGEKLGHSYSPWIHRELAGYDYDLYPTPPEDVAKFLREGSFHGLNVTIPYKKTVVPFCAELSPTAKGLGSVNTIVRRPDGSLYGDNTDYFGFAYLLRSAGIAPEGRKALVLGSGGASVTVQAVLRSLGAAVTVISRQGEDNYENLQRHADAELIVNATPVGMYPGNGESPVDLRQFPRCRAVVDVIYNPAKTALLLQAEELGIPAVGGLAMLVAQAKASAEQFLGRPLDDGVIDRVTRKLACAMENIVLIGMPGCGKTTVAGLLGDALSRPVADSDGEIVRRAGRSIPEIFADCGEETFRRLETEVLADLGKASGTILATGGGCITRPENAPLLRQNGVIFWLRRDLARLPRDGRPISQREDLARLYEARAPLYRALADYTIDNDGRPEDAVRSILEAMT